MYPCIQVYVNSLLLLKSMTACEPYLTEFPGLFALPSPPAIRDPLDIHLDRSVDRLSSHTVNIAGDRCVL